MANTSGRCEGVMCRSFTCSQFCGFRRVWHVSNIPTEATAEEVILALREALLGAASNTAELLERPHPPAESYTVEIHEGGGGGGSGNGRFAFVDTHEDDQAAIADAGGATASKSPQQARRELAAGITTVMVCGVACPVRRRRESRADRIALSTAQAAAKQQRLAASAAKREDPLSWRPAEMLARFPRRDSTLDARTMVAELPAALQALIVDVYLPHRFPKPGAGCKGRSGSTRNAQAAHTAGGGSSGKIVGGGGGGVGGSEAVAGVCMVAVALRQVWEAHPESLTVKELFETVEAYSLIANQIQLIRARAARAQKHFDDAAAEVVAMEPVAPAAKEAPAAAEAPGAGWGDRRSHDSRAASATASATARLDALEGVDHIYDVACGRGLLGLLLAWRFPDCEVVCNDLEYQECFGHYLGGFKHALGVQARAQAALAATPAGALGEEGLAVAAAVPSAVLSAGLANVSFVAGDMAVCLPAPLPPRSFVACVHGCNETNQAALALARGATARATARATQASGVGGGKGGGRCAGAMDDDGVTSGAASSRPFAVMPCCVRGGLYGARSVRRLDDEGRHALQCGQMAALWGAHTITAVDRAITNRAVLLFGGYRFFDDANSLAKEGVFEGSSEGSSEGRGAKGWHGQPLMTRSGASEDLGPGVHRSLESLSAVSARRAESWNGGQTSSPTLAEWTLSQEGFESAAEKRAFNAEAMRRKGEALGTTPKGIVGKKRVLANR